MKNLLFLLTLLCTTTLSAQGVGVGLRAGAHFSNFQVEDDGEVETNGVTAYSFGVLVPISLAENFAIQPELSYLVKGYKVEVRAANMEIGNLSTEYAYIEIPVLLRGSFGPDAFKGYLQAGPAFGYAATGNIRSDVLGLDSEIDFEDPLYENVKRTDISGIVGGGVILGSGGFGLMVDARYAFGISDNNDDPMREEKTTGLTLSAGLLFTLGNN